MIVFEEVDGIGRLQAFGISAGINDLKRERHTAC